MNIKDINKLNLKEIPARVLPLVHKVRRYVLVIFIATVFIIYSFLVLRISTLAKREPSEDEITEKLLSIKRPRINQTDIDKLLELEDNSSEVKALFKQARNNPFHD